MCRSACGVVIAGSGARRLPTYSPEDPFSALAGDQLLPGIPAGIHSPSAGAGCQLAASAACLAASSSAARCAVGALLGDGAVFGRTLLCRSLFLRRALLGGAQFGCPAFLGCPFLCGTLLGRTPLLCSPLDRRTLFCCPLFGGTLLCFPLFGRTLLGRGSLFGGSLFGCGTLFRGGTFLGGAVFCRPQLGRPREPFLSGRLGLRLSAMGTAEQRRRRPFMFWRMRFGGDVDDRVLFGPQRRILVRVEPAAGDTAGPRRALFGLDRRAVTQVGIEEVFEVGAKGGEFSTQRGHLVGGLCADLGGQFASQLRFDRQLVLASSRDLAVELQVVDELEVARLGRIDVALPPIDDRHERGDHRGPQREDDRQLQQFHPVGEHQCRTRHDCEYQQHR